MIKTFDSPTCTIVLLVRSTGRAEITVTAKTRTNQTPFHHAYDWTQQAIWERDLDTLVAVTGAQEVSHAA